MIKPNKNIEKMWRPDPDDLSRSDYLRLEKNENEAEIAVKRKAVPFRWRSLVDSKNKKLGWIDLGNHILVLGIILFAVFIITNA